MTLDEMIGILQNIREMEGGGANLGVIYKDLRQDYFFSPVIKIDVQDRYIPDPRVNQTATFLPGEMMRKVVIQ